MTIKQIINDGYFHIKWGNTTQGITRNVTCEYISDLLKDIVYHYFFDYDFYYNYTYYRNEYKEWFKKEIAPRFLNDEDAFLTEYFTVTKHKRGGKLFTCNINNSDAFIKDYFVNYKTLPKHIKQEYKNRYVSGTCDKT